MGHSNNRSSLYTNNCAFDSTLYFVYSSRFSVILASCVESMVMFWAYLVLGDVRVYHQSHAVATSDAIFSNPTLSSSEKPDNVRQSKSNTPTVIVS